MTLNNPRLALWVKRYPKALVVTINSEGVNGYPYLIDILRGMICDWDLLRDKNE